LYIKAVLTATLGVGITALTVMALSIAAFGVLTLSITIKIKICHSG
jgi:hypothetical protein